MFCRTEPTKTADPHLAKHCIKIMIIPTHSPFEKYCETDRLLRRLTKAPNGEGIYNFQG